MNLRTKICEDLFVSNTSKSIYFSNHELMDMFIDNRALTDSSARSVLSKSNQGRNFLSKIKIMML